MASSEPVFLADVLPEISAELNAGRCVRIYPRGVSMEPMLRGGRDSVLLAPPPSRLRKYDVPLYRRSDGRFVLHRVVKAHDGFYDLCGDNQLVVEKQVPRQWIIAVAVSFTRKGKEISCGCLSYRLYCRLWCAARSLRRRWRQSRHFAGKLKRKIFQAK